MARPLPPIGGAQSGFSYVEVLLSIVLLVLLLVPALEALQTAAAGSQTGPFLARELALRDKMERVLARPLVEIYAETYQPINPSDPANVALSDAPGTPDRRNVEVYRYDASVPGSTLADTGLVYITVYYESEGPGRAISTLVGSWW